MEEVLNPTPIPNPTPTVDTMSNPKVTWLIQVNTLACNTSWDMGGILESLAREGTTELDGGAVLPPGNPSSRETDEGAGKEGLFTLAN